MVKARISIAAFIALSAILLPGCGSDAPSRPGGEDWILKLVASGNRVGLHSSLTTTSDGTVRLVYHDARDKKLYYARRTTSGQWQHTWIDTTGWFGRSPVIRTATGDTLHLAYKDIYHDDLRYARYDGQSWVFERIDPTRSSGSSPTLLVRPDGLHLLDMNIDNSTINYWQGSLSNWIWNGRINLNRPLSSFGFSIGPNGPALAVFIGSNSYWGNLSGTSLLILRTAPGPDGPWNFMVIAELDGLPPSSPTIEFDGDGLLHILFQDQNNVLHDIITGVIDQDADRGIIRLQKGLAGGLWTLYTSDSSLVLQHYTPGGNWSSISRIDNVQPEGQYDLHIAQDGTVHISAYCGSTQELLYGRWEGIP